MQLPASVQEIADVIGDERALYLVGQLPRCYHKDPRKPNSHSAHVIMYVPKALKLDHQLVKILGWHDAQKLVNAFGGEILKPGTCAEVYRRYRDQEIGRMLADGLQPAYVAEIMRVSERTVRNLRREKPQEGLTANNDNNPQTINLLRSAS